MGCIFGKINDYRMPIPLGVFQLWYRCWLLSGWYVTVPYFYTCLASKIDGSVVGDCDGAVADDAAAAADAATTSGGSNSHRRYRFVGEVNNYCWRSSWSSYYYGLRRA